MDNLTVQEKEPSHKTRSVNKQTSATSFPIPTPEDIKNYFSDTSIDFYQPLHYDLNHNSLRDRTSYNNMTTEPAEEDEFLDLEDIEARVSAFASLEAMNSHRKFDPSRMAGIDHGGAQFEYEFEGGLAGIFSPRAGQQNDSAQTTDEEDNYSAEIRSAVDSILADATATDYAADEDDGYASSVGRAKSNAQSVEGRIKSGTKLITPRKSSTSHPRSSKKKSTTNIHNLHVGTGATAGPSTSSGRAHPLSRLASKTSIAAAKRQPSTSPAAKAIKMKKSKPKINVHSRPSSVTLRKSRSVASHNSRNGPHPAAAAPIITHYVPKTIKSRSSVALAPTKNTAALVAASARVKLTKSKSMINSTAATASATVKSKGTELKSHKPLQHQLKLTPRKSKTDSRKAATSSVIHKHAGSKSPKVSSISNSRKAKVSTSSAEVPSPTSASGGAPSGGGGTTANFLAYKVPLPAPLPTNPNMLDVNHYLDRIQKYFHALGYHRQGEPKIVVNTHASIRSLNETAKKLLRAGENIKCLHAFVLAIHLTNCTLIVERFPINFKSVVNGKEYKHVVLGIYLYGHYGALGISRDEGLQTKPAVFERLSDLLEDYREHYAKAGHKLLEIKIGDAITHDPHSLEPIGWKIGPVIDYTKDSQVVQAEVNRLSKLVKVQMGQACLQLRPERNGKPMSTSINQQSIIQNMAAQAKQMTKVNKNIVEEPRKNSN